jgi:hypothetical protein
MAKKALESVSHSVTGRQPRKQRKRKHSGFDLARYIGDFSKSEKTDTAVAIEQNLSQTYVSKMRRISEDKKLIAFWKSNPQIPASIVYSLVRKSPAEQERGLRAALNRKPPDRSYSRKPKAEGTPRHEKAKAPSPHREHSGIASAPCSSLRQVRSVGTVSSRRQRADSPCAS